MTRTMNLLAVKAAIASAKTPANLKKGLIKKYGHLLEGVKMSMSTLATTMKPNPRKKSFDGKFPSDRYIGNPKKKSSRKKYDIIVVREGRGYTVVYPAKKYIGNFKKIDHVRSFLKPAVVAGLKIDLGLAGISEDDFYAPMGQP